MDERLRQSEALSQRLFLANEVTAFLLCLAASALGDLVGPCPSGLQFPCLQDKEVGMEDLYSGSQEGTGSLSPAHSSAHRQARREVVCR